MIRAAIVGVSGYGRWHLLMAMEQALVGRLRLVGAAIINQHEEAMICGRLRRHGVPVFDTFEAMLAALAGQIDLVLLPTALHCHAPMTLAALRAGAHVLVEKPVAATLQEVDEIIGVQAAAGRVVGVGFQELYAPAVHEIKHAVLAGEIGPLRHIVVRAQWPRPASYYTRNHWAGRLRANGRWVLDSPVSNAMAHFAMLALFWAGTAAHGAADIATLEAELYRAHAIESFDTASLRVTTETGVEILFFGSHAVATELAPEIHLFGERGEITWRYEKEFTLTTRDGHSRRVPLPLQLETRLNVLEAVVGRIKGLPSFVVGPDLGRIHTRLIDALHEFFPIHTVPAASAEPHIAGLEEAFAEAAARRVLLSATGAPWAVPARPQALTGYRAFRGCWAELAAPVPTATGE
jgi:predicted dehydrogenase